MKLAENQRIFKEGIIEFSEDGSREPHLSASRCPKCGKVYFPKKDFCPPCMLEDGMEEIAVSNEGILYTFSIVHMGVRGFKTPYVLGWVDLPREKLRIAAQIVTDAPLAAQETLRPGQKVKLNIGLLRTMEDGTEVIGYRYAPAE